MRFIESMIFIFLTMALSCTGGLSAIPQRPGQPPAGQQPPKQPQKPPMPPSFARPPMPTRLSAIFTSPGIATLQGSEWVGSEHLYHLPEAIGIVVEIIKPATTAATITITEEKLKEITVEALKGAHIRSRDPLIANLSLLPFLHILVIAHPIEKGFVAYCALRLFEEVQVPRIFLKAGIVWQAITWEKQELLVTPPEQANVQIEQTIQSMLASFADRIKSYPIEKNP